MLFCLDIGNTQVFGGVFAGDGLRMLFRRNTSAQASSDEYGVFFRGVFRENGVDPAGITQVALCSVVPGAVHSISNCIRRYFGVEPFVLGPGARTGLKIRYRNPVEVGADKIANAIGAVGLFPNQDLLIVDFGTATTICAVSAEAEYLGGVITPGLRMSMEALGTGTARLPEVEIARPETVLGRSTVESIQSGLYHGTLAAMRALCEEIAREQFDGRRPRIVATGGFGRMFANAGLYSEFIPELPLLGLRSALERSLVR